MSNPDINSRPTMESSSSTLFVDKDKRRVHIPAFMPFFWLGISVVCGVWFAALINLPVTYWAFLLGVTLLVLVAQTRGSSRLVTNRKLPFALVVFFFCVAGLFYQLSLPGSGPDQTGYYNDKGIVEVEGVVVSPPEQQSDNINLIVRVDSLKPLSSDPISVRPDMVSGKVLLQVPLGSSYQYGDKLRVRGGLEVPSDGFSFSYRNYLFHQGILSLSRFSEVSLLAPEQGNPLLAAIYRLRSRSLNLIKTIFPEPESALLRGILLGDESGLSKELRWAYSITGTAHIIAISGFNMAVLAGLISRIFTKKLGAWKGAVFSLVLLAVYTILVGAAASVIRAAIMSSFSILGSSIRRRGNLLNSLGFCVFIMVLADPHLPWDIGFQLSVMATLGMGLYTDPLNARLESILEKRLDPTLVSRIAGPIGEYFIVTFAAQALVLPLLVYHFRNVTPLFIVANPLVLPAQPLTMILGLAALSAGLLQPVFGRLVAWIAWPFVAYTNRIVAVLARTAPAMWQFPPIDLFWVFVFFLLVFVMTINKKQRPGLKNFLSPAVVLVGLGCLTVLVWTFVGARHDGKFSLRVMQGSKTPVVLAQTSRGRFLLVGGSLPPASLAEHLGKALPPFTRQLDFLIIPSCGKSDVTGLFGLDDEFQVGEVLWACDPDRIQTTRRLYQSFQENGVLQTRLVSADLLVGGDDEFVSFLLSEENMLNVQFSFYDFKALVNFDAPLVNRAKDVGLLITQISPEVECPNPGAINATVVVISSGEDPLCLEAFGSVYTPLHLENAGWLEVKTDGHKLWLYQED